ncbi:thioesterase II family protein [Actinophytocola sp.]|uniref:thioesterase II family protein n=1 Tax=Actinophytocola sp. TaxID=1872138 RepID=UPI003D6C34E5
MIDRWLIREPDQGARGRLFCLPVSGVGASVFQQWPVHIDDIEVCPVQLPGRENRMREPAYTDMREFASAAATALEPYLDRPYALFGHCYGARLSYALAVALTAIGTPAPERLFVSSCLAPHRGGYFGGGADGPFTPETTDDEFFAELRRGCAARGEPAPPEPLMAISVRALRADTMVTCGYAPDGPEGPPFDVTAITWSADTHVRPEEMHEWKEYGTVHHVPLNGDEFTHRSAPDELLHVISGGFQND